MEIHYFDENVRSGLNRKRNLSEFIAKTTFSFLPQCEDILLNYVFCNDEFLLDKNVTYLNHDTYTDVITFDLSEQPKELIAEIYISVERVKENAKIFGTSYVRELHRVIFHGLLHLCGFNDKTPEEQTEMRIRERDCMKRYFREP